MERSRKKKILTTIQRENIEKSHERIYKTHTKIEAKKLRATNFAIAKLKER